MYALRIPALNKAVEQKKLEINPQMTRESMNNALPNGPTRWAADNYNRKSCQLYTYSFIAQFANQAISVQRSRRAANSILRRNGRFDATRSSGQDDGETRMGVCGNQDSA
jgi:hypothetical protein